MMAKPNKVKRRINQLVEVQEQRAEVYEKKKDTCRE